MLSENIKKYRKKLNLSQDELAEKLGVSRQSVSFWETGQTQPTIDNIIALAKVFDISTDVLLGNSDDVEILQDKIPNDNKTKKNKKIALIIVPCIAVAVIIGIIIAIVVANGNNSSTKDESTTDNETSATENDEPNNGTSALDLFSCCKNFAIENGELNGDYSIYQQSSQKYGGYENEYFSITYWSDSDMVEFCLHCPLSDTQGHNFYLRMRGGYDGTYEYASSKYYRDTGESFRFAMGYIDPAVFSDSYPIPCALYEGSADGQTEFMEETRVGICDLIKCLKQFVIVEGMDCDFSKFDFINF